MGLFDFVKDAGETILKRGDDAAETDRLRGESIKGHIIGLGLAVRDLSVTYDDGLATVTGVVSSAADEQKILVAVGNIYGVARVDDRVTVEAPAAHAAPEPAATLYTVKSGDTLGGIAKAHYGNAGKYPVIFEANKPMLKDPNKIYPGQVLRIPPLG
ncbi:MAG: peptidoglycan-binding protein LysM [Candidatus Krumholzibacteriia bacterium]